MKLYEAPRNSLIRVVSDIKTPPGSANIEENEYLHFHHIDGMYSYCTNRNGEAVHLVCWAEVVVLPKLVEIT